MPAAKRPKTKREILSLEEFQCIMDSSIDTKAVQILAHKPEGRKNMTFADAIMITGMVRNVFRQSLKKVPPQIEAACKLSEAVLAPSAKERTQLIKMAYSAGGGVAGIAMIIGGVGAALGWGAGITAAVTAFFVGGPLAGPIIWISIGVAVAAIAGYMALSASPEKDTERFLNVLKNALHEAVAAIWKTHGAKLAKAMNAES